MLIKQLSVFVENKKGRLSEILGVLSDNNIDISALSIADTTEFGILRMIVSDPETAKQKLRESGVIVKTSNVIGMIVDDKPGALAKDIQLLSENGVTVEYTYAFLSRSHDNALVVLRADDNEKAEKILENTALHFEHGDGWVFTFFDENGKEFSRILEGGKTSYIKMSIIVDTTEIGKEIQDLLEPQFVAETID